MNLREAAFILGATTLVIVAGAPACGTSPCETLAKQCGTCGSDPTTGEGIAKLACETTVQADDDKTCQFALDHDTYAICGSSPTSSSSGVGGTGGHGASSSSSSGGGTGGSGGTGGVIDCSCACDPGYPCETVCLDKFCQGLPAGAGSQCESCLLNMCGFSPSNLDGSHCK